MLLIDTRKIVSQTLFSCARRDGGVSKYVRMYLSTK